MFSVSVPTSELNVVLGLVVRIGCAEADSIHHADLSAGEQNL